MLTDLQINEIRARFRVFDRKIYLNTCSQGALSDAVEAGFDDFIASWHAQGSPWERWIEHYEAARATFAQFINASPDEVAIVTSVSAGINSVASAEGNLIPNARYEEVIDRQTLIVPLTHVCFKNGFRSEVSTITQIAHGRGAFVMLDDYQDCGTRPVNVKAMDLDFYLAGTLKYLLGPPGLAFLYVRKELISTLAPSVTGWFAQTNPFTYNPQHFELSPTARRFESGTPSIPNVYGAVPGFQLLQKIGMDEVAHHIRSLTQQLLRSASEMGIVAKTPADSAGPLVVLQSRDSTLLAQKLAESGIVASNRFDGLRISFHVYNTTDDVDAVAQLLKKNIDLMVPVPADASHD